MRWGFAALFLSVVVGVLVLGLRMRTSPRVALPPPPSLSGKPEEMRERLTAARARAAAPGASLGALADLGRMYHVNGFESEAVACWQALHAAQPKEAHWTYYLADLAELASDNAGRAQWLERTVALAPDYSPAWLALGELYFKGGQLEPAERAYRRRLELVPRDPYAALGLARIALQRGQRTEGKRQLEELIKAKPDFSSARNVFAEILAQENDLGGASRERWLGTVAGRFRAADDPWKNELRPFCYNSDQFVVWGETDYQTKHGDFGRKSLERAVELAPHDPRANEMLARFYLDMEEPATARDLLEKECQLPGPSESLLAELSEAYMALDQTDRALQTADRGLRLMPDSANLYNARGLALASARRFEDAIAAYRAAIDLAPGSPTATANFGLLFLLLGQKDAARTQLQQALRLQPGFGKAVIALASIEMEAGNFAAAAQYVIPYFQQYPGSRTAMELATRYFVARALAASRQGDPSLVERTYREGLALMPESAELHGVLGVHYIHVGKLPEALETLETAYRIQPRDPRILSVLGQLYIQIGRSGDARKVLREGAEQARQRGDDATAARFDALLAKVPD